MYGNHFAARFVRPMTLGVRAAVIDASDRVLLVRHSYVPGWHLPGGAVEAGETVADALARELREEGAVELSGSPVLHGIYHNTRYSRRDHVLVYVVRDFRLLGERKPDWEIVETGFFPIGDLPEGTVRATRERLAEILQGAPPAPLW
ncbi:MAG: NUDIX domain-containing protein [Beijerinckiaceae bacterium]